MANEPDPPNEPAPPTEWSVYEQDRTPDPEPAPPSPPSVFPPVPYASSAGSSSPIVIRTSSSGPKLVIVMIAVLVLGVVVAGAIALFAAVDGGVAGIGGIDAKDPDDFADMVDELEEKTGSTEVFWVGLYDGYIIIDVPYTDDPKDTREVSYDWRGGDLDDSYNKSTSSDPRFDLREIDPAVIEGICEPILDLAEGATPADCYVFISKPDEPDGAWFYTSASDDFNRSYSIQYDIDGVEVSRTVP